VFGGTLNPILLYYLVWGLALFYMNSVNSCSDNNKSIIIIIIIIITDTG